MSPKNYKKQFCIHGHDKNIVGQDKSSGCSKCKADWADKNIDGVKISARKFNWKKVGITNIDGSQFSTLDYDRAYQMQQGCCKICRRHSTEFKNKLSADHDHTTGIFRGLLCVRCNLAVGVYENKKRQIEIYLNNKTENLDEEMINYEEFCCQECEGQAIYFLKG